MPPTKMRDRLVCIQDGRCIYTGDQLTGIDRSLDHVVPWSRARLSQIENLVITSRSVNSSKSDSLLAPSVIETWLSHVENRSGDLEECANEHGWMTDLDSVRRVALHIYKAVDSSTGVWSSENGQHKVEPLGQEGKQTMLDLLQPNNETAGKSSVLDKS